MACASLMRVIDVKIGGFLKGLNIKYTDELIGRIKVVSDFLPKPKKLVIKKERAEFFCCFSNQKKMS